MRQAVLKEPGVIALERSPVPTPGPRELLLRVEACGVCGSDRAILAGHHPVVTPVVLGHEFAGTVVECGALVTEFEPDARVSVDPNVVCGTCRFCRRGLVNHCERLTPLGITLPGGYAEYALVPETNAYTIQDSTTFEMAAIVEPLACCVRGIEQADVQLGDVVVIFGAGPIGLLLAQLARLRGAALVVSVDPVSSRRELARTLGVDAVLPADTGAVSDAVTDATNGIGADVVIESSGQSIAAQLAVDLVRKGGAVVWFGVCPQHEQISLSPFLVNDRELTVRGSNINPFTHQTALTLIERGRVRVAELISDHIGLDSLERALRDPQDFAGKPIVHPGDVVAHGVE
jgi:L-iditol 2-dehydrogenase